MSNYTPDSYNAYLKSILALVRTLVIKFDAMAMTVNYEVLMKTGVLPNMEDRKTWKWYLNSAGIYHVSDDKVYVTSLDDETTILFDAETLKLHPITARKYAYGTELYKLLLEKHPKSEKVILGSLYPIDIDKAISAEDGDILSYPGFLVEDNEIDLINELAIWGKRFSYKWRIRGYEITDDLYRASFLGQFTLSMVGFLIQYRLSKCKTSQAHSYHVRQYLKSRGFSDSELSTLNYEQRMYFYRNIDRIRKNAGMNSTNKELIEVLFTKLNLPVYQCFASHRTIGMRDTWFTDRPDTTPSVEFIKKPLNQMAKDLPMTPFSLDNVNSEIAPLAPMNKLMCSYQRQDTLLDLQHSLTSTHPTKVLECAPSASVVKADSSLLNIIFDHWVYLSHKNKYITPLEFTIKGTSEPIVLDHQTTIALWAYGILKQVTIGGTGDWFIPKITLDNVITDTAPTFDELYSLANKNEAVKDDINTILSVLPTLPSKPVTPAELIMLVREIGVAKSGQKRLLSFLNNPRNVMDLNRAICRLYTKPTITLDNLISQGITRYSLLFTRLGLDFSSYSKTDFLNMSVSIFEAIYGTELRETNSETSIRATMMSLFSKLSSYSIIIAETGVEYKELIQAPTPAVRAYHGQDTNVDGFGCNINPMALAIRNDVTVKTLSSGKILSGKIFGVDNDCNSSVVCDVNPKLLLNETHETDLRANVTLVGSVYSSDRDNYHMLTNAQKEEYARLFIR